MYRLIELVGVLRAVVSILYLLYWQSHPDTTLSQTLCMCGIHVSPVPVVLTLLYLAAKPESGGLSNIDSAMLSLHALCTLMIMLLCSIDDAALHALLP